MRLFIIILLVWFAALLCILGYVQYTKIRENKIFSGKGTKESLIVRVMVSAFMPNKNSKKYRNIENKLFILNPYSSVRDIVLMQVIGGVIAFILSLAITGTNIYLRQENAYAGNSKVPITLSKEEYNQVVSGISFDPTFKKQDLEVISNNIKTLTDSTTMDILTSSGEENIYEYLNEVNYTLNHLLKPQDFILVVIMIVIGFFIPLWVMNFLFSAIASNELIEFDTLETLVYMMCTRPVYDILRDIEEQSLYYSSMTYRFRMVYERSHETAYEMVAGNQEFPANFKRLCRYLNIIENSGAESARVAIEAHKKVTSERIFTAQQRIIRKRMFVLKALTMFAFILAFLRVLTSMLSMLD